MNQLQRSAKINSDDLQSVNLHEQTYIEVEDGWVALAELIDATQNFSPQMETGRGLFGLTYKAELQNYRTVAVEKISPELGQEIDLTRNEIDSLKLLNHEHVVRLYDFYSSENLQFLVYEYMAYGSLHEALRDVSTTLVLKWEIRFNICLGIAKGIEYLHSKCVVHRNIRSSNVLIDQSLTPKISNTGMSKVENQITPTMSAFTRGYMAPEQIQESGITEKVDVYSYGILLLELVSGRQCEEEDDPNFLLDEALDLEAKGSLTDLVDGRLSNYDKQQANNVLKLAIMCTSRSPSLRPSMTDVVKVLKGDMSIEQISQVYTISI